MNYIVDMKDGKSYDVSYVNWHYIRKKWDRMIGKCVCMYSVQPDTLLMLFQSLRLHPN